jgi:hypothetical protein
MEERDKHMTDLGLRWICGKQLLLSTEAQLTFGAQADTSAALREPEGRQTFLIAIID